jgi:hypothetical protein
MSQTNTTQAAPTSNRRARSNRGATAPKAVNQDKPVVNVVANKELANTADMAVGQAPTILLANDLGGITNRESEDVALIDTPLNDDYFDELAFMEEKMIIVLNESNEDNPAWVVDVHVNGRTEWVPVGKPHVLARKFVEVLVRSKADAVLTQVLDEDSENPQNIIKRTTRSKHTFSVVRDDNPRGVAWLVRLMAER